MQHQIKNHKLWTTCTHLHSIIKKSFHNYYKEEKITFFYIKAATRKLAKTGNKNVNKSPIVTKSVRKPEVKKKTRGRKIIQK